MVDKIPLPPLRPAMKQEDHPEHNMPPSEHQGTEKPTTWENDSWLGRVGAVGRALSGRPGYGPEYK